MSERRKFKGRLDSAFALFVLALLISYSLGWFSAWSSSQADQAQRESECRLISGTWAAERGMCFVPNTTLNGLNP